MAVDPITIIALANGALDLAIRLFKASRELPGADSPEALAKMKELEGRLTQTLADVKAYKPIPEG